MGPPIFMTIGDWVKVAQGWYDFLPKIRKNHKVSAPLWANE